MRLDSSDRRRVTRLVARTLVLCLVLVVGGCSAQVTPTPTAAPFLLRIGYTDSLQPLIEAIVPILSDELPTASIETDLGHVVALEEELEAGQVEVIITPREPDPEKGWWTSAIAVDGITLIANRDNRVSGLTLAQAQAIFQGKLWLWEMVGGAPAAIEVVTSAEESAIGRLFQELVMEEQRVTLTAVLLPDTEAVLAYVASRPWAIGYVAVGAVDERVKLLAVDGLYPSVKSLTDQSYPLSFPIYVAAAREPEGEARLLPAWLISRDGQAVIGRHYGRVR